MSEEDPTPQLSKVEKFTRENPSLFPKLSSALKELRQFVGACEVKETVARSIQYIISHQLASTPVRKSTRKRKEPRRLVLGAVGSRRPKRPRLDSVEEELWDDEESDEEGDDTLNNTLDHYAQIIAAALRHHGMKEDEDSDEEISEERVLRYKQPEYLKGLFQHTMLLGRPGTGKTTFAHIMVGLWHALNIIDKKRFFVTSRGDWVGKYQGHSVDKARKMIAKARGGVIFIDEAYSLIAAKDGDDTYGHEVLTEIVEAMSNSDKNVIFIFAGYSDDMTRLFGANKGLSRRFGYIFKLKQPDALHLFLIFQKQLLITKWKVSKKDREAVVCFFQENRKIFEWGGGSTSTLIQHAKQAAISRTFPSSHERKIRLEDMKEAYKTLQQHNTTTDEMPDSIRNMYM